MAESGVPDLDTQKSLISEQLQTQLQKGDIWYIIDVKWFKQFKGYESWNSFDRGHESANPGPIDNSPLYEEDNATHLKESLIEDLDFVLVPDKAWDHLLSWYTITEGQSSLPRKVIEEGLYTKSLKVEVYPWHLKICENSTIENQLVKEFSRSDTIEQLEQAMRLQFNISDDKEVRLWNQYSTNNYEHLNRKQKTLQEAGVFKGQVVIIEQRNEDGSWPRQPKETKKYAATGSGGSSFSTSYQKVDHSSHKEQQKVQETYSVDGRGKKGASRNKSNRIMFKQEDKIENEREDVKTAIASMEQNMIQENVNLRKELEEMKAELVGVKNGMKTLTKENETVREHLEKATHEMDEMRNQMTDAEARTADLPGKGSNIEEDERMTDQEGKLALVGAWQNDNVRLNIGDLQFLTSSSTLNNCGPNLLTASVDARRNKKSHIRIPVVSGDFDYFFDRDSTSFHHILQYLRLKGHNFHKLLPSGKELHILLAEAEFFGIEGLVKMAKEKLQFE